MQQEDQHEHTEIITHTQTHQHTHTETNIHTHTHEYCPCLGLSPRSLIYMLQRITMSYVCRDQRPAPTEWIQPWRGMGQFVFVSCYAVSCHVM